jgi:hypothetical protein
MMKKTLFSALTTGFFIALCLLRTCIPGMPPFDDIAVFLLAVSLVLAVLVSRLAWKTEGATGRRKLD